MCFCLRAHSFFFGFKSIRTQQSDQGFCCLEMVKFEAVKFAFVIWRCLEAMNNIQNGRLEFVEGKYAVTQGCRWLHVFHPVSKELTLLLAKPMALLSCQFCHHKIYIGSLCFTTFSWRRAEVDLMVSKVELKNMEREQPTVCCFPSSLEGIWNENA